MLAFLFCIAFGQAAYPDNYVRVASSAKIRTIDPADISDVYSTIEVGTVYEGLLQFDETDPTGVRLVPNLAEKMPRFSKDHLELRLRLRRGVYFQDDPCFKDGRGRELVAQDVIESWNRLLVPGKPTSSSWIFGSSVKKIEALGKYELTITLKSPQPTFLFMLAQAEAFIVPAEAVAKYGADFGRNPVGTGPFVLDRKLSNFNSRLIYHRNPKYWNKSLPRSDGVTVDVVPESRVRFLKILNGELDITFLSNEDVASKSIVGELGAKKLVLQHWPGANFRRLNFNMKDPVWGTGPNSKKLRQALSLSVDSKEFIDKFLNGYGVPAQGPLPPGTVGYNPKIKNPYRVLDVERAKRLLAEAGYTGGQGLAPLRLIGSTGTVERQQVEWFKIQFERIGIRLEPTLYTWPEFRQKVKKGEGQSWLGTWYGQYPDAEDYLKLYWSGNDSPGPNETRFNHLGFDKAFELMKSTFGPERVRAIQKAEAILREEVPAIWLAHESNIVIRTQGLIGLYQSLFESTERKRFLIEKAQ